MPLIALRKACWNATVKWPLPQLFQIVTQLFNSRLVTDRGKAIRLAGRWFGGIFSADPMDLIEVFGLRVVRLEVFIVQRPRR